MNAATEVRPVVMLGIDAAEHLLIDSLIARGRMPTLAGLRQRGSYGLLRSPAHLYSGAVWPTFYSGRRVPWHGVYHNKLWQPDRMCCVVPDERTYRARPFWESLEDTRFRTCVVDVPLVLGKTRRSNGVYLNGWATHDLAQTDSSPSSLRRDLRREFGPPAMPPENFGPQDTRSLKRLLGDLLRATEQLQRVSLSLLRREAWDFTCIIFGAAHRAGHYLWDLNQARDAGAAEMNQRALLTAAVERIYEAIDCALGELLAQVGADARVIVFSLHGMGPNGGWSEIVPEILDAWQASLSERPARRGTLYALRNTLVGAARPILKWIPPKLTAQFVPLWSSQMFDWQRTRVFPLPMDQTAFIRVNMRERERDGVVSPGSDYQALCAELQEFFHSLCDVATERPIVSSIVRAYEEAPPAAPYRDGQPDLIVRWEGLRTSEVPALKSSRVPAFKCPVPRWLPSGRSGNHLPTGWFIAAGRGIAAGETLPMRDILDLAPTARSLLGLEPDTSLHGAALPLGSPA
jgi:predicted AlkP superfamily phosphohydrolase/phosphomutase